MTIRFHEGDLPENVTFGVSVAIDTETMGLHPHRDRLCVVQDEDTEPEEPRIICSLGLWDSTKPLAMKARG